MILAMLAAAPAAADEVVLTSGAVYSNLRVGGVVEGSLVFELGMRKITKDLLEVRSIRLDDQPAYNAAEALLAEKKYPEAAAKFAAAGKAPAGGAGVAEPVKSLAVWRQMHAWEKARRIDRALALWLPLAEGSTSPAMLRVRPRLLGEKGSEANAAAIRLLTARAEASRDNTILAATLTAMLEQLTAVEEGSPPPAPPPSATRPSNGASTPSAANAIAARATRQLAYAGDLLGRERFSAAAAVLEDSLDRFSEAQLPEALLMLGKARIGLAPIGDPDTKGRLIPAGLSLMRVWVYWPDSPQAPEALLLAAVVNRRLGNTKAAALACRRLIADYPGTSWAKRAEAELAKLE